MLRTTKIHKLNTKHFVVILTVGLYNIIGKILDCTTLFLILMTEFQLIIVGIYTSGAESQNINILLQVI